MFHINSIPNWLCLLRLVLTPVLMALVVLNTTAGHLWAAGLLVVLALTDVIDGRLARRLQVVSPLGIFLDTISDKVLIAGVLLPLIAHDLLSVWIGLIILGREFIISGLRAYASASNVIISAGVWGKQKFTITVVALVWRLLAASAEVAGVAVAWNAGLPGIFLNLWVVLMALAIIWTVLSAVDYIHKSWPLLRAGWTPRPAAADSDETGTDTAASTSLK
jgi:CDP-diacylglycerol--glycerol-3-phosphate 3-phosphatidyltransferase